MKTFKLKLYSGNFSDIAKDDGSGYYNAIIGGSSFGNPKSITANLFNNQNKAIKINFNIIGKLGYPAYIPEFGSMGSSITTDNFLISADVIIIKETPKFTELLREIPTIINDNFFVVLDNKMSSIDKNNCIQKIKKYGLVSTFEEILNNTNSAIEDKVKRNFPIPLFSLFVSTISLISVSILLIYKKLYEYSIYFLCGCNRIRCFFYMTFSIGLISILAGMINILIIFNYQFLVLHKIFKFGNILLDNRSIYVLIIYVGISLFLSILFPFLVFRKSSPIEVCRRFDQ